MSQIDENTQKVRAAEEQAAQRRAGLLGFRYLDSRGWSDQIGLLADIMSLEDMYKLHAVPVQVDGGQLLFAITSTTPQPVLKQLRARTPDYHVNFVMISDAGYKELMLRYDPPKEIHYDDIAIQQEGQSINIEEVSRTLETVRADDMLNYLITQAQRLNASDIHLENEKDYVRMRFRVDGTLHAIARLNKDKYRQLSSSIAIKANISVANPDPQTGHMNHEYTAQDGLKRQLNMRIETAPTSHGQDAVIRLFTLDRELMQIENLGMTDLLRHEVNDIIQHPHGMVMVVGPTGSGKTTTLYSILHELNQPTRKIITLEDPVEYNFEGVMQIPVKAQSGDQSFADHLRAVLRLDPDVIMIGEIRDADTAKTALQAALTGHLVLSTFHASDASSALARIMDIIGDNPLFSNAIRLVLAQRLVRRLDDSVKQPYQPDQRIVTELQRVFTQIPHGMQRPALEGLQLFRPGSSPESPFGYKGRLMIAETLRLTLELQTLLRRDPSQVSVEEIRQLAVSQGMVTLLQVGLLKAIAGLTSLEEIYRTVDA